MCLPAWMTAGSERAINAESAVQDPKKVARGMQLLQLNEEIKSAKKVSAIAPSTPADILVKDFATTGHALPVGKDSVFTSLAA